MNQDKTVLKLKNFRNKIIATQEDYTNALRKIIKSELPQSYTELKIDEDIKEICNQIKSMVSTGKISKKSLIKIVSSFEDTINAFRSNLKDLTSKIEQELYSSGIYRKFDFPVIKNLSIDPLDKVLKYYDELDNFQRIVNNSIFELNGTLKIQEFGPDGIKINEKQEELIKNSILAIYGKFSNIRLLVIISVIFNFILGLLISFFFLYQILVNIYPEPTAQVFTSFAITISSIIIPIVFAVLYKQKNLLRNFDISEEKKPINLIFKFNEKKNKL